MAFGLKTFDASGNVTFDSSAAYAGNVILGLFSVASGASGFTNTYPSYAGFTPFLISFDVGNSSIANVAIDTSLGYPRMIVSTYAANRLFMLGVQ